MRPDEQSLRDWRRHLPAGAPDPWPLVADDDSLTRCWRERWRERPDAVALVDLTAEAEVRHSRADLAARSTAAARLLHERGVRRGDRVLFSGGPSASYLFLYVGALRLGAVIVPANTGYTTPELAHIVADSGAVLAVVDDPQRIAGGLPVVVPAGVELEAASGAPPLDQATARDLAMIAYTSGTTGRPKGAMLSHGNLLAGARAVTTAWRWTADDGLVLALPLFHLHGLGVGSTGALTSGGRSLLPGFKPELVAVASARRATPRCSSACRRCTSGCGVRRGRSGGARALASLRLVVSGSAPLAPSCGSGSAPHRAADPRALRHDRDDHEHLEPVRRRASPGHRRVPAARRRGAPRRRRRWRQRRDPRARRECVRRLLAAGGGHRAVVHRRRLVPHRRHRRRSTRRLLSRSSAARRS